MQGEQQAATAELNVKLSDARYRFEVAEKNYKAFPENVIKHRVALGQLSQELRRTSRDYEKATLMFAELNPRFVEAKSSYEAMYNEFETFKERFNITEFDDSMLVGLDGIVNRYNEAEATLNQLELSYKSLQAEVALVKEKE